MSSIEPCVDIARRNSVSLMEEAAVRRIALSLLVGTACLLVSGCASMTAQSPDDATLVRANLHSSELSECQFEYGQEAPIVDGLGNLVGIPRKLLLWNRRVKNHRVSARTEDQLRRFVEHNELAGVKVRVNQYAPIDEWRRLIENDQINPLLRYTAGTVSMLGYTLVPGRVFGRDEYNPYTNTVSIYSDVPSLGIAELAYAKDLRRAKHPSWYALSQEFAGLDMIHSTRSTQDALDYLAVQGSFEDLREGYQVLYPAMGLDVGDSVGGIVPQVDLSFGLIGAAAGHVAGRTKSRELAQFDEQ